MRKKKSGNKVAVKQEKSGDKRKGSVDRRDSDRALSSTGKKNMTQSMKHLENLDEVTVPELNLGASMKVEKGQDKNLFGESKLSKRSKSSRSMKRSKTRSHRSVSRKSKKSSTHLSAVVEPTTDRASVTVEDQIFRKDTKSDKSPGHILVDSEPEKN